MADSLNKKKPGAETPGKQLVKTESISIADIEKLFSLMRENDIAELELEQDDSKIHIVSKSAPVAQQQPIYMQGMPMMQMQAPQAGTAHEAAPAAIAAPKSPSQASAPAEADEDANALPPNARHILSPMVGTFYASPSPDSAAFVRPGDVVNEDTVLCIVEAMKLMNEIKAETKGKIVRVLVENGMPVEYNQPLFVLEP